MALVLSGQIHAFTVPEDSVLWVAVFSEEYVPQFARQIKGKQGIAAVFNPEEPVLEFVRQMLICDSRSLMMKKACLYAVCDNFLHCVELVSRQEKTGFPVGELLDWVACHYTEPITLKQAAETFGYEYHYLSRLLNRSYRISFVSLVNNYRVEHAVNLLRQTQLPVSEIVTQSGFQSIRSFNQVFLQIQGCSPNACRKAPIDKAAEFS